MQAVPERRSTDLPIGNLSVRAKGVLQRLGIEETKDLARLSEDVLRQTRNCGQKTVREIGAWHESLKSALRAPVTSRIGTVTTLQGEPAITSVDDLPVELLLKMSNFALSVRARRCLEKQGIDRVGDLVILSEIDLLRAKNCGRRTLKEIRSAIGSLGLSLRMKVPVWKKIDADEFAKRHATVLARIRRKLRKQLYALDSSAGVEAEIASVIAGVLKTKDQAKIELWLGLDQSISPTLQQVGEVADVTRERIRQIVQRAQRKLQGAQLDMKKLRASIKLLEKAVVLSDRAAIQLLGYECLVDVKVTVRGLLRAAELFGVKTKLTHEQVG